MEIKRESLDEYTNKIDKLLKHSNNISSGKCYNILNRKSKLLRKSTSKFRSLYLLNQLIEFNSSNAIDS
jgi:hypothetical protein